MKLTLGICLLSSAIFLTNCKGDEELIDVTISGILYDSCGGQPAAGVTLTIGDPGFNSDNILVQDRPSEVIGTFTTNEDGRFSYTFHQYISSGYLSVNNERICEGRWGLGENMASFDVGEIYAEPFRKPTRYDFYNIREWKSGEYVVAYFTQGNTNYRDTFNASNSTISGNYMKSDGYIYYGTKIIHKDSTSYRDTVSSYGRMLYTWQTKKHRGTEAHFLYTNVCDKEATKQLLRSDL